MHNRIQVQSLKKYRAEVFIKALKTVKFPNYNIFSNVKVACSVLLNKIIDTIVNVTLIKIKNCIKIKRKRFKRLKK